MTIWNFTQHKATPEQVKAGVKDLPEDIRAKVVELLTFDELPDPLEVRCRAMDIALIAFNMGAKEVMIGGAPFLMPDLDSRLHTLGINPLYAFSKRECIEETLPDGSVRKTQVFRHLGFVGRMMLTESTVVIKK